MKFRVYLPSKRCLEILRDESELYLVIGKEVPTIWTAIRLARSILAWFARKEIGVYCAIFYGKDIWSDVEVAKVKDSGEVNFTDEAINMLEQEES